MKKGRKRSFKVLFFSTEYYSIPRNLLILWSGVFFEAPYQQEKEIMKKIFWGAALFLATIASMNFDIQARSKEEDQLVKEMTTGLPVYLGNGLTWRTFDIDNEGTLVIGILSNNLPEAAQVDDKMRDDYKRVLTGESSKYAALSRALGRKLIINIINPYNELCISETLNP